MTHVCKNLIEYKARHIRLLDKCEHFENEYSYPSTSGSK